MRRALSEPPAAGERATLLLIVGTAEWRAGRPDAIAHLEQALAAADEDPGTLIGALSVLAFAFVVTDHAERSLEVLDQILSAIGDTDAGLALTAEAAIALVEMATERTAPGAVRRAEGLRGRRRGRWRTHRSTCRPRSPNMQPDLC